MKIVRTSFLVIFYIFWNSGIAAIEADSLLNAVNDSIVIPHNKINDSTVNTISIIAVGDIMLGTNFLPEAALPPQNDCNSLLERVLPILKDADITFGNLEGCFLDHGPVVKKCSDTTKCYAFRMPVAFSECLTNAGFNMVSLANNHIRDFGDKGEDTTLFYLAKNEIRNAGLENKPYDTITVKGVKVGMLACSPFRKTLDMNNYSIVEKIVKHLDTICDVVMVSFHGGGEGKGFLNINRKSEFFYGEDRGNIWEFAHMVVDAGADLIIGHGPHVPRAVELYSERLICYSLGNFCTYARFNLNYPNSLAPIIKVEFNSSGKLMGCKIISAIQKGEGGPIIDEYNNAFKLIKKLSEEDFPESKIVFLEDGVLGFH